MWRGRTSRINKSRRKKEEKKQKNRRRRKKEETEENEEVKSVCGVKQRCGRIII